MLPNHWQCLCSRVIEPPANKNADWQRIIAIRKQIILYHQATHAQDCKKEERRYRLIKRARERDASKYHHLISQSPIRLAKGIFDPTFLLYPYPPLEIAGESVELPNPPMVFLYLFFYESSIEQT
jgi:hypothetical protein